MSKLESVEVNPQLDCVIIECSFVNKIHKEILATVANSGSIVGSIDIAIRTIAHKYGAEAYLKKEESSWYLFRFKTEQDKLAFILKNV
jgi:hypothetical protein